MAAPAQIEIHRHFHAMSAKDEDTVVQAVAELVVSYLKQSPDSSRRGPSGTSTRDRNRRADKVAQKKETQA